MDKKQGRRARERFREYDKDKGSSRQKRQPSKKQQGEIMAIAQSNVITMAPTTPIYEAMKMMAKQGFRRMPVVDPGTKKLLGLFTVTDIIDYLGGGKRFQLIEKKFGGNFYKAINEPIRSIMNTDVVSIDTTTKIAEAMEVMKKHNVGGLPVVDDDGRICAIVTEQDIVRMHSGKIKGTTVSKIMSTNLVTEKPDATIIEIEKRMIEKSFRRLPIVSNGEFIGMATVRSLLRFFSTNQVFQHLRSGTIMQVLQTHAIEVTIKDFPTIHPEADIGEAAKLMQETHKGSLAVIESGKLIGIITERDFFKLFDK